MYGSDGQVEPFHECGNRLPIFSALAVGVNVVNPED
jgi:hypothetical protein